MRWLKGEAQCPMRFYGVFVYGKMSLERRIEAPFGQGLAVGEKMMKRVYDTGCASVWMRLSRSRQPSPVPCGKVEGCDSCLLPCLLIVLAFQIRLFYRNNKNLFFNLKLFSA